MVATVTPVEKWANLFGDRQQTFHFKASQLDTIPARAAWTLAMDGRVLARGEVAVTAKGNNEYEIAVPVRIPPVKDGIVLPLDLKADLLSADNKTIVEANKRLWVFPSDAFAGRKEWLKNLNIRLFDPVGVTAQRFEEASIPFKTLGNADALSEGEPGVAVIGEGVSFEEYRGLFAAMIKAASSGHAVLCLAPAAGTFILPGSENAEFERPAQVRLADASPITSLDKRLDVVAWPQGSPVTSTLTLKAARNQVVAEVSRDQQGWSWLEASYGHGKLIVCGFGIVSLWDDSPTPRFLIARILEYLYDAETAKPAR